MKVTAFIGTESKNHTYDITEQLLEKIQSHGNIEYEIVRLSEYKLEICKGCKLCFDKGEDLCPHDDDRDKLIEKIINSDGVIFSSPNYSFQVSALMKIFLERLAFYLHRPRFFGKTFTSIVTQGVYGGKDIVKYFNFVGRTLGFNVIKGSCIKTIEPITEKQQEKINKIIDGQSERFYTELMKEGYPTPSIFELMLFRMARTKIKIKLDEVYRDYTYYKNNGWFHSDYYYPVKLNPLKKVAGKLFDMIAVKIM